MVDTLPPICKWKIDEHGPIVKETIVLEGPILHFHDCGRKSNSQIAWSPPFIW